MTAIAPMFAAIAQRKVLIVAKIEDEELTARETGALMKVTEQTLANWRSRGTGPPYRKLSDGRSGRIRYRRSAVEAWLSGREMQPGGEAA